jgi:ABC-type microcin C transport system permease subunit YejE
MAALIRFDVDAALIGFGIGAILGLFADRSILFIQRL